MIEVQGDAPDGLPHDKGNNDPREEVNVLKPLLEQIKNNFLSAEHFDKMADRKRPEESYPPILVPHGRRRRVYAVCRAGRRFVAASAGKIPTAFHGGIIQQKIAGSRMASPGLDPFFAAGAKIGYAGLAAADGA